MSVRYRQYVVKDAMNKLNQLGVSLVRDQRQLTDDELEALIRGCK